MPEPVYRPTKKKKKQPSPGDQDSKGRFTKGNSMAYAPGNRANPNGRPKKTTLSSAFKSRLATICDDPDINPTGKLTWAEVISLSMVREAATGKVAASKELRETTEGSTVALKPDWKGMLADMGVDPAEAMDMLVKRMEEQLHEPERIDAESKRIE